MKNMQVIFTKEALARIARDVGVNVYIKETEGFHPVVNRADTDKPVMVVGSILWGEIYEAVESDYRAGAWPGGE